MKSPLKLAGAIAAILAGVIAASLFATSAECLGEDRDELWTTGPCSDSTGPW